jgi:hypothetical protein
MMYFDYRNIFSDHNDMRGKLNMKVEEEYQVEEVKE